MPIDRKSVVPMAAVTAPGQVAAKHQSLLHFVGNAPWSDTAMLAKSLPPRRGGAVTLSLANHDASLPVAYRLDMPEDWAKDQARLVDYPSHLARMWILVHGAEIPKGPATIPFIGRLLPDLAWISSYRFFRQMMTVEQAGRVFIALMMGALIGDRGAAQRHPRAGRDMADLVSAVCL